ncbi:hypothetical protein SAMN06269250_1584 [Spirosoma fluviale]|uniref:PRTRC system protein F n=1 Tax=Spirosoma fluviale TaxID=1597977 RepID=A0A286FCB9_9BACT|nr:hypothetical protein SAMN06269250_1584 [Spirosoma fluviale]
MRNRENRERDFFKSLSYLCDYYDFPHVDTDLPYPLNIHWQMERIADELDKISLGNYQVDVVETDDTSASLYLTHTYDTALHLWYIPVKPIQDFRQAGKYALADLLTSTYAYLYRIVGIDYFTESGWMAHQYDWSMEHYLYEMDEEEMEPNAPQEMADELKTAIEQGNRIKRQLDWNKQLNAWTRRLDRFQPATPREEKLKAEIRKIHALYLRYPDRKINQALGHQFSDEIDEDEYFEGLITIDQYLTFIWEDNEFIQQTIQTFNQCEFANASAIDEPRSTALFDSPTPPTTKDINFDCTLLSILNDFLYFLTNDDDNQEDDQ